MKVKLKEEKMISKELLSEVLGYPKNIPYGNEGKTYKLSIVGSPYINENGKPDDIYFQTDAPGLGVNLINIYELAHKCKEWATENKYTILTEDMYPNGYFAYVLSNKESIENYGYLCEHKVIKDIPHNKTEPEAIFKACQWILDNKN